VTLLLRAPAGVTGSRVLLRDYAGKLLGSHHVSGGDGRGGQAPPVARFALLPGKYTVEVLFSTGERRGREIVVASGHLKGVLDDKMPKME
jgi:hypothetical protein